MYEYLKVITPTLALALLLSLPGRVAAEQNRGFAEAPWYEFEVLIFQRIDRGAGATEAWPITPDTPSYESALSFDTRGRATLQNNRPIPYRPLPAGQRRLGNIWTALRNSGNYRPLYHVAWRQQVVNPNQAQSLYVYLPPDAGQPGPMNPPKLEGTLKFGVKRYLHLQTDLLLRLPIASGEEGDYFSDAAFRSYRMQANRRMRSGKLHYLDHPVLGILVQAERYEAPTPEPLAEPNETVEPATATPQTQPAAD
jgi:hypothetical protein